MSSKPVFLISPAHASHPAPVVLVMPKTGYTAVASIAGPCGRPVRGATLTVRKNVAIPHHLPHGTSYVQWTISAAGPAPTSGARVHLVLASKQTVGHATSCLTGASPYGHGATTAPGGSGGFPVAGAAGGGLLAVAVAATAVWRLRQRRPARVRGSHAR